MMKLPDDRNERIKVLAMIGLFSAAILYAIVFFLLMPHFAKVRDDAARLVELEELLWRADRDIQQTLQNRSRNTEIITEVLDISETQGHILRPSLGNYLLVAEAILTRTAEQTDLTISNIRETSGPPPQTDPARANQAPAFWPYAVSLTLQTGLHDLARFIHVLRQQNPYLTIVSMSVSAGTDNNPARHTTNMTVQWPVWLAPDHPNQLAAELLADGEQQ